jgi:hypothetical protein
MILDIAISKNANPLTSVVHYFVGASSIRTYCGDRVADPSFYFIELR